MRGLDSNMKFSTKVSIFTVSLVVFSVGMAFALVSNSDEVKIRELISEYQNVLNNEEIEKIPTLYSKQAIFMPPEIPAINGVEEIGLTYEYLFSQFDFELKFDIKEVVISENFAYVHSNSEGTITLKSSETEETSKNQEIFILIKEGDNWKISRYIFNSWN
jgi:ketosteroid isomerase-like protein